LRREKKKEEKKTKGEHQTNTKNRGLEADQKVIAAHGCYAMTATTALTAQNTKGVYDIHQVPVAFLRKQIDACLEDVGVDVVKTGELYRSLYLYK